MSNNNNSNSVNTLSQNDSNSGLSSFLKTDASKTKSNAIDIPSISLPKGGGALKGIDEKFLVNAVNGTASFSIPLPISPSRAGFQPMLQLAYNSGVGNSLFGIGWGMDIPSIQRRTDKKLPQYKDDIESDVFLFAGAEDLVPVLDSNQKIKKDIIGSFEITNYRPRIEGLFAKIEKVQKINQNDFFWKLTAIDNTVTFFGTNDNNRIANPLDKHKIFKWLPSISFDDKGNCMLYEYKEENKENILDVLHEKNRLNELSAFTNKHIKKISYGNKNPYYPAYVANPLLVDALYEIAMPPKDFMFSLVFNYGEHINNSIEETATWKARKDAFSEYKSGFDIRTYRQCQTVLMFHHFKELGQVPFLVRSMNFNYESAIGSTLQNAELSYLTKITQTGFGDNGISKSLPPATFQYQPLKWHNQIQTISAENIVNSPVGLGNNYQWLDFFGEGISGILSEQADAWYYKSNLGNGEFTNGIAVSPKPSLMGISNGALSLQDIESNGKKYIVSQAKGLQGYFEQTDDNDWLPFKPFTTIANIDTNNPNVKFLDLNGDGMPDLVISDETVFTWYPSKGVIGYDSPELAIKPFDEEKGPAIVFADSKQSIYMADMSGDGLTDIVQIENNRIAYWPNLGYGKFGAKVTLSNFDGFDHTDLFNPSYIHLADVSGTGTTDILYLGKNKCKAYLNLSGNAFSKPFEINPFWNTTPPNQISVIDLLGSGMACIVWSSSMPANTNAPLQFINLMGNVKPHIMIAQHNGMGKQTTVTYKSSTEYYLEDKKNNKPWVTKLPFPVQCVSQVEVIDTVTDLRFCTKYKYHHGYFDHAEREFRGFGMVEQIDTEEYQYLKNKNAANATDIIFHEKPILTKTWQHTGAFLKNNKIFDAFEKDYWYNHVDLKGKNTNELKLPDAEMPQALSIDELREAYRCCKGMTLRQEIFSLDGTPLEKIPYSVATHNCHIKLLQPKANNAHAVFLAQESEAITYSYERNVDDPRIAHSFNIEIDDFGNVLKAASVAYGRNMAMATTAANALDASLQRHKNFIVTAQTKAHIVYTETKVTTDAKEKINGQRLHYYHLPTPFAVKTFEVTGIKKLSTFYQISDFKNLTTGNVVIKRYEEQLDDLSGNTELRLIEEADTLLLSYDLKTALPFGTHGALAMPFESYQLAYTSEIIELLFNKDGLPPNSKRVTERELVQAKYVKRDNNWWIRSGDIHFFDTRKGENRTTAQQRFYAPVGFTDPFGSTTAVEYDSTMLFVKKTIDALGNETSIVDFDFRVLAPAKMKDINDNVSEVRFDALGLVAGMAIMGKGNQADDIENFNTDLTQIEIDNFFNDPFTHGNALLKNATARTIYDFNAIPAKVGSIVRETHTRQEDGTLNATAKLQYSFEYTGGMGNSVLKKVRAEAGLAKKVENEIVVDIAANPRWVGNGRTVLNNKGKPIKQYEPYFSITHLYEDEPALQMLGVTPVLHYDAAGRQVRTDMPDGTFTKVAYDSWQQKTYDQNDTILDSKWKKERENPSAAFLQKLNAFGGDIVKEKESLQKSLIHANTPSIAITDSLGRPFYTIAHNKWEKVPVGGNAQVFEEFAATRVVLDIEGNTSQVIDARDNIVMQYHYDMLGQHVHQHSMDAGNRWLLNDSMGKPTWAWDSKNQLFETDYDIAHRPTQTKLIKNNQTFIFDKMEYGTNKTKNENGVPIAHFNTAGVTRTLEINFKGEAKKTSLQLCATANEIPDWNNLDAEIFISTSQTDALGRVIESSSPHDVNNARQLPSIYTPTYNDANLLEKVTVSIRQQANTIFVKNINYDAKGQREKIDYGNNTNTVYTYDSETFRLRRLLTKSTTGIIFQDLIYTYDPVGNIINIEDKAQQTIFFANSLVAPINNYRYDATYRLIEAKGREHIGQNLPSNAYDSSRKFADKIPNNNMPNGNNAMRNYTELYTYDAVGNMVKLQHIGSSNGSWTRNFNNDTKTNRLLATDIGGNKEADYDYDIHGNMLNMPHLPGMQWNFKDQLQQIQLQASADNDNANTAHYTYDASGQRTRKIIQKGSHTEERLYLGGFEIFRKKQGNTIILERESLHIMDDQNRIALVENLLIAPPNHEEEKQLVRYQYSNHLGTASIELTNDATPQVISYEEYHPYGSTAYQNQNKNVKAAAKRYRYTGMERDEESGLNYHTARYYAPWLCRWTAADPIGIGDGVNVYRFVKSNPIIFTDKNGKEVKTAEQQLQEILSLYTPNPTPVFIEGKGLVKINFQRTFEMGRVGNYSGAGKGL